MPISSARAFTLAELLVVVSIVSILGALLLSALSRAKQTSQTVYCLNNTKQLVIALHLYASDQGDWLPPNPEDSNSNRWVFGNMQNPLDVTNVVYLIDPQYAKLAAYTGRLPGIYKCPADYTVHVRTFSMNQAVGTNPDPPVRPVDAPWLDGSRVHVSGDPWQTYGRFSAMNAPAPSLLWILLDENGVSINDAAFAVDMELPTEWVDWSGVYHSFGCNLAYADAHSETRHWTDPRTKDDPGDYGPEVQANNADILWLQQRTSAKTTAAPL